MAYQVARRHVAKLRIIGLVLATALPLAVLLAFAPTHLLGLAALLSHVLGVMTIRWLFFAEAKHVMSLYYGR